MTIELYLTLNNAGDEKKAILIFGSSHASISIVKNYVDSNLEKYDWIPLGFRLKQYYGSSFSNYAFYYLPKTDLMYGSRLVLSENLNRNIHLLFNSYDGFIIEPKMVYGTFYQYNPTNENLKYIFSLVKDYALHNQNSTPDTRYLPFDEQGQFLMGIYYLKLYFGDKFDYSFWRTKSAAELLTVLNELEQYAFTANKPSSFIKIRHTYNTISAYHNYMGESRINDFLDESNIAINEEYLLRAAELFPEDLWALYWLAFFATEKKQYDKAFGYFQTLFANELAFCMESLPLAYRKAALCARKLKNRTLEAEYSYIANSLYNEYGINVDGYRDTGYQYKK